MELSAETYYKQEKQYRVIQASHRLVRFVILDVELLANHPNNSNIVTTTMTTSNSEEPKQSQSQQQQPPPYAMAEVLVARESDMGNNDRTFSTITHLGHEIEAGDIVLGYDLTSSSMYLDDDDMKDTFYNNFIMPDIVLVKKAPPFIVTGESRSTVTSKLSKKSSRNSNKEKRQSRRRQNDGKRARELEERAKRMGFIEEIEEEEEDDAVETETDVDNNPNVHNTNTDNDDVYSTDAVHGYKNVCDNDSVFFDADIEKEVLALEREFETLDIMESQSIDDAYNDEVASCDDNVDKVDNETATDDTHSSS
jgi:hypothetical protein